ncbi:ABC transporter ATP-binding protein [Sunxiuqinia sp. sy24]|uniref:ABC transporter ATP-binding protein n=1 Tax=Sunxiuqinia sp. sy24 TaxID=3461495 RepID=UPI004045875A
MINIQDVTKIFSSKMGDVVALHELNMQIPDNKFVLIKGPSGCGKSTLLFTLGGLLKPSSGQVKVLGKEPFNMEEKERTAFLSSQVGFVFQSYHLIPYLTVLENILFSKNAGNKDVSEEQAQTLAEELNITDRLKHYPSELSIGEKQRVALARALIVKPELILADEPTGNLDPENTQVVLDHLRKFQQSGGSVVMVSHGNEADHLADCIISMKKGKITNIRTN